MFGRHTILQSSDDKTISVNEYIPCLTNIGEGGVSFLRHLTLLVADIFRERVPKPAFSTLRPVQAKHADIVVAHANF